MTWEIIANPHVFPDPPSKEAFCNVSDRALQLKLSQAYDHLLFQWQGVNELIRVANILIPPVIKYNGQMLMVGLIREGLIVYSQCLTQSKPGFQPEEIVNLGNTLIGHCDQILNADVVNLGSINVINEVKFRVLRINEIFSQKTVSQRSANVVSDLDDILPLVELIKPQCKGTAIESIVIAITEALEEIKLKLSKPRQLYHADEMLRNFLIAFFAAARIAVNFVVNDVHSNESWSLDNELPLSLWIINRRRLVVEPADTDAAQVIERLYSKIMPDNIKRAMTRYEHETAILSGTLHNCF